jgi:signal transduction histidine kinase
VQETALVSLEEVVETVTKLARPLAEEKQLELRCTVDKNIPRVLFGDPLRISQIIQNFLSNAVKFTSKGYIHVKVMVDKDPACTIPSEYVAGRPFTLPLTRPRTPPGASRIVKRKKD